MKKLLLLALAACIPFGMATAQDPANYHIYFGNVDGSAISVGLDRDIEIPVWVSTDPTPGNPDTVNFVHIPLKSDDLIITARTGGFFPPFIGGFWDDISFLAPDITPGFTSQSILGFAYITDPLANDHWLYTLGANILFATYTMHTANDPLLIGTTPCPFSEGANPANGGLSWGMADGVHSVVPTAHYGCLYFSPNAAPTWVTTDFTVQTLVGVPYSFHLVGADIDLLNTLTITGPGGVVGTGTNGTIDVVYTGSSTADEDLVFTLSDGTDPAATVLTVHIDVTVKPGLVLGNQDGSCTVAYPGGDLWVPVYYNTDIWCGGFVILVNADPTALTLTNYYWNERIDYGNEFHQFIDQPYGMPGTQKYVWISDMNNGVPHVPAAPDILGNAPLLWLKYRVSSTIGIGAMVNVTFVTDGPDSYTYNTTSDSTGYQFIHPPLVTNSQGIAGACIDIVSADHFKGDPNMNGVYYEIADDVLVARRLIHGICDTWIWTINLPVQEAAADLNNNGFADVADLVRFINITTGAIPMPPHPKTDPNAVDAYINFNNGSVDITSTVEVGGVVVRIAHTGSIGTPVAANGMDMLYEDANGVLSVVIYSQTAQRIPAGTQTLFTLTGNGTISEVQAADANGDLLISKAGAPVPTNFAVSQNYPNPFNAKTLINFALPTASDVTINVYNITGQVVESIKGHYEAGNHSVVWDASQVASGVYFAKVSTGSSSQTLKMTLLK